LDGATPRRRPARHATEPRRATHSDRANAKHNSPTRKKRAKRRLLPRTAPLFDGVPELGSGGAAAGDDGYSSLNAIAPPAATPNGTSTGSRGLSAAVAVPGLLALAALALAGATLHRRRRLARPAT
jgi:hypothetical protein